MGISAECIAILEHIKQPAFFVKNAEIVHVNTSASKLGITANAPLNAFINITAKIETEIQTVRIQDIYFTVSTAVVGEYIMYVLEQTTQIHQVQSIMRAAQHLRIPLSNLEISVKRLKEQAEVQNNQQTIYTAKHAIKYLFSLQRTLRNMSDITDLIASDPSLKATVNVFEFFKEIAEKLVVYLEHTDVYVTYSIPNEQLYYNINSSLLERALYNMVSNSINANSHNIHIEVAKAGKKIRLTVSDDGIGISSEEKKKIFSKFNQSPGIHLNQQGMGFGMIIVHAAAKAHDGTLLISDAVPNGCKISLTIENSKEIGIVRQSTATINVNTLGGIDPIIIELAEHLPDEYL